MSRQWLQYCRRPVKEALERAAAPMAIADYWKSRASTHMISSSATVLTAAQQMAAMRLSYVLVMQDFEGTAPLHEAKVMGLATERTFLKWALETDFAAGDDARSTLVGDACTVDVENMVCARPEDSIGSCLRTMNKKIFRHLPIIDDGNFTGILKLRDMLPLSDSYQAKGFRTFRFSPLAQLDLDPDPRNDNPPVGRWQTEMALAEDMQDEAPTEADNLPALTAPDVWGSLITAGAVLHGKRRKKGVHDASTLKSYLYTSADIHTVRPETSVADAMRQLTRNNLTFLVVVDESSHHDEMSKDPIKLQVMGLVSERHFLQAVAKRPVPERIVGRSHDSRRGPVPQTLAQPVGSIMTKLPQMRCVRVDTLASDCLGLMLHHNIRHLPVLSSKNRSLAGILSLRDLLAPLLPTEDELDNISVPEGAQIY